MDGETLWNALEKRRLDKDLLDRIKEMYAETRDRMRVGLKERKAFWADRGLRQGCPLIPMLFAV